MSAPVALAWDEQECADGYEEHGTGSGSSVGDDPDRKGEQVPEPVLRVDDHEEGHDSRAGPRSDRTDI